MAQAEDKNLPSLDDYIIEDEFPSVEEAVDTDLPSIEDNKESNLPSIEEEVEAELPSVEEFVEKEEELVEEVIVEEDLTLDEVKELIEEVKAEILDIPQIKHFDEVLEKLCEAVDQVKSEIPEVPEPKVYDDEIEAICDAIDSVKEDISSLPEVKYYDEQVQNIEDRIDSVIQEVANLPEPKYYDTDLDSIKEDITKVREELAPLPWVENTFLGIEENFEKVSDVIDTLKEKLNFNFDEYSDSIDVKFFESKVETQGIKEEFESEKEKIWDELKKSSVKIFEYQKTFKDDDRKLKKQILGEYNKLKNSIKKELEEATDKSIKTDELLLGYFTELKGEISNLPEVKYYDEEIDELQKLVTKFNKRFSPVEGDIKSLYRIVEDIKKTQIELNEQILDEPADVSQDVGGGKDPLTPTDQKFATLDDLSKHYTLFVNRIQQQLSTVGGGGAGFIKDLADVDISGLANGYILQYNASENKWETVANSGGGAGSITVKDEGSTVGTAGSVTSIDFVGDNITATASGVGATITFSDTPQFDSLKVTGLSTFSDSVTIEGGKYLQLNDSTNIVGHNGVNNLFRFSDDLSLRGDTMFFQTYNGTEYMRLSTAFGTQLKHNGTTKLTVDSTGITVSGQLNDLTIPSGSGTIAITDDIPTNNNELTNGAGYITTSFTNTNQLTNGAGFVTFTNTNQLTNGAGFITASDDITGTAAGLSGSPDITVGAVTATSGEFSGNVTIGGTLTYEDVTNVDSIGVITARSDVIVGGDITANGNIVGDDSTDISGINSVTATSFHGDGSNLTGVASTDNIITGTAATFNNVVNVGTGITLDATSGIITATNFFGYTQGQVSYITATETLTNKTLRNPTFESGANSPEFLETRYVNATQQDFVQLYTGGSSGSYFTQGEYQKIATITPSGNFQNYTFNIRLTATSASNYQIVNFTGGLRANTLPDLDFTVNFSEEHNGVRFIEPKLWTKETTTAGFILAFEYVHSSSLFGGVNVEATIIPRSSAQRANVVFNTTQDSEQDDIDTGFTERDPTLTVSTVNGVPIFGTEFKIEGSTDDGFETTITTVDATADRTITFPDSSGTVALVGDGSGLEAVVDDTSPQLGGNLDLNSKDITGTGNVNITGIATVVGTSGTTTIGGVGNTALYVDGNARVVGVLTVGRASVTIDGDNNQVSVGIVTITNTSVVIGDNVTINTGASGINSAPNVLYVAKDGDDDNNGTSIDNAFLTIKAAVGAAQSGTTVKVLSGNYVEDNPIELPAFSAVVGDDLRTCKILPNNATSDIFHVNKGCKLQNMTFSGHLSPAAAVAFPDSGATNVGGGKWKGPYVQNCTSDTTTGTGIRIDGSKAVKTKSMNVDAFTQYNQGGVGVAVTNEGYAQLVSVFTICCDKAITCHAGGQADVANSNCSFGTLGLVADGKGDLQYIGTCTASADAAQDNVTINVGAATTRPYDGQIVFFGELFESVETITVGSGGTGYTSTPTVTVDAPTGSSGETATAFATLEGESVASITIISSGSQYQTTPTVTISAPDVGVNTATATATMAPIYYTINSSTPIVSGITTLTLEENLINAVGVGTSVHFFQQSKIVASSHTFEYIGAGNTITEATPKRGGVTIQANEVTKTNGGNVVYTSTDQSGNFRIGDDLQINQNTGTISGRAFSKSLFSEMTPFILALS